jgi:Zn-dependent metalloprotease
MRRFGSFVACALLVALAAAAAAGAAPSASRATALGALARTSSVDPVLRLDEQTKGIAWLTGRWASSSADPVESSLRFLEANRQAFGIDSPRSEFAAVEVTADDQLAGWRDVYLQQRIHGVPVLRAQLAFHYDDRGRLVAVSGDYLPTPEQIQAPLLDADEAAHLALEASAALPGIDGATELPSPGDAGAPLALSKPPSVRLVYYLPPTGGLRLAYEVGLTGVDPSQAWILVVDARTGAVLDRSNQVQTVGRGINLFGRKVTLRTSKIGGAWKLVDRTQYMYRHHSRHPHTTFEGCIEVRDCGHSTKTGSRYPVVKDQNGDNFFNHGGRDPKLNQRSAVSLAQNLTTTYKTMRARLGRNSVDGKGLSVIGNVHLGKRFDNAYWSGDSKMMYFGDNVAGQQPYAKSLDVVAHEYGHGVTRFSVSGGGFVYEYPSGALSEAFSDIWGSTVDSSDWTRGEDLGPAMRNLENPAANELPASMDEYQMMVLPLDGGGNHINCTIGGHFFQQLASALPVTAPARDGRFTAAKIVYRSYAYLTPRSSYRDWAIGLAQAAADLYGADSTQAFTTRNVLTRLGMISLDFGQNDNGWCLDANDTVTEMQWSRAAGMCYLAEKFTAPAGAKLARVYLALDADPSYSFIAPGQALRVFVVGVAADGGPELSGNALDYEPLEWDAVQEPGRFTPVSMTADDFVTPRTITVPQQFFIMVGFYPDDADENTMLLLQDDGSTPGPSDRNWVISTGINWNDFSYYWIKQTLSQWTGMNNPRNFMMRPMYWYDMGNNRPPAGSVPEKASSTAGGLTMTTGGTTVTTAPAVRIP